MVVAAAASTESRVLRDAAAPAASEGNLLAVVYANLHRPPANGVTAQTFEHGVRRLITFERALMRLDAPSFYRVVLATRDDRVPEPAPR